MTHEVIVSNIGRAYTGDSADQALITFKEYEAQSKEGGGRAAGEQVTWLADGEILKEYRPPDSDGPTPGTYFKVWVELEMVNDDLDQYENMDLGFSATAAFKYEADALKFAHALHACGEEGLKRLMPAEVFYDQ
jgi:hypothetical protein